MDSDLTIIPEENENESIIISDSFQTDPVITETHNSFVTDDNSKSQDIAENTFQAIKRRFSIHMSDINDNDVNNNITEVDISKSEVRIHRNVGNLILILLFLVGVSAGIVNGVTLWVIRELLKVQSMLIMSNVVGVIPYMIVASIFTGISAFICKQGKLPAAVGSGIPEVKALLASDFHPSDYPSFLSIKIECIRITSLIFAMGSGLAVGSAGPLVHSTVCTAYSLTKFIPEFGDLSDRRSTLHQIFVASAAAGLATVFNAPIGGLLFSIEVTSTYYLISNYWKSFMAAVAGAVTYSILLEAKSGSYRVYEVDFISKPYLKWEYLLHLLLGFIVGMLTYVYLKLQQRWFLFAKPYLLKHPIATAALVGGSTALIIFAVHGYDADGLGNNTIVYDTFTNGDLVEMKIYGHSTILSLFISLIIRVILVTIAVTLRISCGIVVPMFAIGGISGRLFGTILQAIFQDSHDFYIGGYAMVGAVAFLSGTTQTISGAIIIIEMTGQLNMLLPCLIGALVASSITKYRVLSLYDQGMVNKNLESFELLFHECNKLYYASDLMNPSTNSLEMISTIESILNAMSENKNQNVFAVVESYPSMKLIGCIHRIDIYDFLLDLFRYHNIEGYLRYKLPHDTKLEDDRITRDFKKTRNKKLFSVESILLTPYSSLMKQTLSKITTSDQENINLLSNKSLRLDNKYSDLNTFHIHNNDEENQTYEQQSDPVIQYDKDFNDEVLNPLQLQSTTNTISSSSINDDFIYKSADKLNKITSEIGIKANKFRIKTTMKLREAGNVLNFNHNPNLDINDQKNIKYDEKAVEILLIQQVNLTKQDLIPINNFPSIVHQGTTIDDIYILFEMVHVSCIFVTNEDKFLEGMIDKEHLLKILKNKKYI